MGVPGCGATDNAGRWPKGKSGNSKGAPKKEESLAYWIRQIGKETQGKGKAKNNKALAQIAWKLANKGDATWGRLVMEREAPAKNINENINKNEVYESEALCFVKADLMRTKEFVHPWYKPSFFHREIADALMDENIKRLIVTLPPQHGKSEILCKTFPAWFLGNNPDKSIIVASYNQEYVNKLSVKCRDFFLDPAFQSLYGLELHPEQQTKHEWLIKKHNGGAIFSRVGGTTTGNTADILLIDDVNKDYEDASSKVKQEAIWNWYDSVVGTRLQGEDSRIIIIMTRWMKNDLIGKILKAEEESETPEDERFKVLHYPAILNAENGDYTKGKPLWPEKKSLKFLLGRQRANPAVFKTMWQGNPRDLEGLVIKPEWITVDEKLSELGEITISCRGWDLGYTEAGNATVGARIDIYEKGEMMTPVLSDVKICKKDPSAVQEFIAETAKKDGKDVLISLESGGTQGTVINALSKRKDMMDYQISPYYPRPISLRGGTTPPDIINNNKVARAMSWILSLESGHFRLAAGLWNKIVIDSMVEFSDTCDEDDIEDAITIAWKKLFGGSGNA